MLVIAQGYAARPYVREFVRKEGQAVIVANPDCDDSVRATLAEGVGFPANCVFEFDSGLSDSLSRAWSAGDQATLDRLWSGARLLST